MKKIFFAFLLFLTTQVIAQTRLTKITGTAPIKITGTAAVPNITITGIPSSMLPTLPCSIITSGKFDTARLPVQIVQFISEAPAGLINGTNTVFKLSGTPASTVQLFINGLRSNAFTIAGVTITMKAIPKTGDVLLADYFKQL